MEYNLSLIPESIEKLKAAQSARGCKVLSVTDTINGYDSITEEVLAVQIKRRRMLTLFPTLMLAVQLCIGKSPSVSEVVMLTLCTLWCLIADGNARTVAGYDANSGNKHIFETEYQGKKYQAIVKNGTTPMMQMTNHTMWI